MGASIIKVEDLGKRYIITHEGRERYSALRDVLSRKAKKIISRPDKLKTDKEEFWALRGVSFEVQKGDTVGIIGRNGAGKSTLLKILSRITEPSTGRIEINGRIASLLEVGTGFHPELTGRENIFLNGAILGMSRAEIRTKFDEIVDFSGVEKFLDTPVKRYSSGMYVRLAFAVAAHLEPEILLVDEVLAVGDAEFQKKCLGKMDDVANKGRTVFFVSHDLSAINQLCRKGILLHHGTIKSSGTMREVVNEYLNLSTNQQGYFLETEKKSAAYFKKIYLSSVDGVVQNEFYYSDRICINFEVEIKNKNLRCNLFVMVLDHYKRRVFACESENVSEKMQLIIDDGLLVRGSYSIHTFINIPRVEQLDVAEDVCPFLVIDNGSIMAKHGDYNYGVVFAKYQWLHQ